jgi:hypothetical protein
MNGIKGGATSRVLVETAAIWIFRLFVDNDRLSILERSVLYSRDLPHFHKEILLEFMAKSRLSETCFRSFLVYNEFQFYTTLENLKFKKTSRGWPSVVTHPGVVQLVR